MRSYEPCSIKKCPRKARARGWCTTHYKRWQKHGDPEYVVPPPAGPEHYAWKGDAASYGAHHMRIRALRGSASACVWGCEDAVRYEWANLTGNVSDPDDYAAMCMSCHRRYDDARRSMEEGFVKHPRGASRPGELNAMAKLTQEIVQQCIERRAAGERVGALAREFGVSGSAMSLATRGKRWKQEAA